MQAVPNSNEVLFGDYLDTATSPGESFVFWIHHANTDRNFMIWQVGE